MNNVDNNNYLKYNIIYIKLQYFNSDFIHINNDSLNNIYNISYKSPSFFLDGLYFILKDVSTKDINILNNNRININLNDNNRKLFNIINKRISYCYNLRDSNIKFSRNNNILKYQNNKNLLINYKNNKDININLNNTLFFNKLSKIIDNNNSITLKISIKQFTINNGDFILNINLEDYIH
tara:strand:- start:1017 stop:1556 length:540 start_codon:yes stop_codon:yes gene_type:complete